MIYQRCYHLSILEVEKEYFGAMIKHCKDRSNKYVFEWDKDYADENEYSTIKRTKEEFKKFLKKEFYGYGFYVYDFETCNTMKLEKFYPATGSYLIFKEIEWHEFLNNWLELTSSEEEISSSEEEELNSLWKSKFPAFDLYYFYNYSAEEAFGETLASYLD